MIPKVALFAYRQREYALPVEAVEHIIPSPRVDSLPRLPGRFQGVIVHAGDVIPLLDLSRLFELQGEAEEAARFVVLIFTEFGILGLPATQVRQIVDRAEGVFEPAARSGAASRFQRCFVREGVRYPLLDTASLMTFLLDEASSPALA